MDSPVQDPRPDREIHLARERPFRLGAVEVRPATREVIGPRGREVLEPRVMQVLVALAQADGEVVGRDELTARCWEGRVVGEDAISRVISRLRRLSEGLGRDGWTLETVTKVGYRLAPAGAEPNAAAMARSRVAPSRRWLWAAGGGAAVALAGAGLWWRMRPRPISPQAQALYDKGREALRQGGAEPVAQAVGFLREAVTEAPQDARSWGALALAYQTSLTFTDPTHQAGVRAQAEVAARRALDLDGDEPDGAAAQALLAPTYRNWLAAETLFDRALRLHPTQPVLQGVYAQLMLGVGRVRRSVTAAQASVTADAYSPVAHHGLARSLWSAGRTEEAEIVLRKALGLWPEHYALWFLRFNLLSHTGRADQAIAIAQDVANRPISIPASDVELSLTGARALATRAPADIAHAIADHTAAARKGAGYAEGAMGWMSGLGRLDDAFRIARGLYFDEGFAIGGPRYSQAQGRYMVGGVRNTHNLFMPQVAEMRADPRFRVLLRDIGIAEYWRASGHGPDDPTLAGPV